MWIENIEEGIIKIWEDCIPQTISFQTCHLDMMDTNADHL